MGFLEKLLSKGPGGPASTAKAMLQSYNICRSLNPDIPQTEAFRQVLQSRYSVIRKLDEIEINVAALSAESIGDLITMVLYVDNPISFSRQFLNATFCELEKFYMKNAPEELESLTRVPSMIMVAKDMKCSVPKPF